jgi:hypothetical protein
MALRGASALPTALVIGVTNGTDAPPGTIGEYISSTVTVAQQLTNATAANITSIALTPGDWDAWGVVDYTLSGQNTVMTVFSSGISGTSATFGPQAGGGGFGGDPTATLTLPSGGTFASPSIFIQVAPKIRINISAPTTVYLVAEANFGGTVVFVFSGGTLQARRRR